MATLLITKETGGYFSFVVDADASTKVINMRNDVLAVGNVCNFKTANGANVIKKQNIDVTAITLNASGVFTFTDINVFLAKLIDVGFYDWLLANGIGSGSTRFDELIDTFTYFGRNMQAVRVNESQQKLETFEVYNYRNFIELEDAPNGLVANKILSVSADGTQLIWIDKNFVSPSVASPYRGTFIYTTGAQEFTVDESVKVLNVFLNRVLLDDIVDWTIDGNIVTIITSLSVDDEIKITGII
jgi:hypothetical protein